MLALHPDAMWKILVTKVTNVALVHLLSTVSRKESNVFLDTYMQSSMQHLQSL